MLNQLGGTDFAREVSMGHWAWFTFFGCVLLFMGLSSSWIKRAPLSTSVIYLALGVGLGSLGIGAFQIDVFENAKLLEHLTELCVSISLFTAGLKLRLPWKKAPWRVCLRLAFTSMAITVGLIAMAGVFLLDLPWGAAILLGGILAPTDPVLASDVQIQNAGDPDQFRFSLTGEAGLNDGTAFPFVMLGLGLLGVHEIGDWGWKWFLVDGVWSIAGGLGVGALLGLGAARGLVYLRCRHKEAVILDDFLALGLLALSYGLALGIHTYAFLAVFAAGFTFRLAERHHTGGEIPEEVKQVSQVKLHDQATSHPEHAPAYAAQAILVFNEQVERLLEVGMVIVLGALLTRDHFVTPAIWFIPLLFLIIRPLSTWLGLGATTVDRPHLFLFGWFGIRGIGSIYYLSYALTHGLQPEIAHRITPLVLSTIAASVVCHGISVTPLMTWRESWLHRGPRRAPATLTP